jgi:ribosomal protein S18 acetylase RimI-like enzyme
MRQPDNASPRQNEPMSETSQPRSETEAITQRRHNVRAARAADMAEVEAIDARITGLAKPEYWAQAFARYGDREDRWFLVAEADGRINGFIIGEKRAWEFGSPRCGWIFAIGVDPALRLGGVGTRLFEAITQRMHRAGLTLVRTMLARDDALNMAFFRSQGMMGGAFIQLEMQLEDLQLDRDGGGA